MSDLSGAPGGGINRKRWQKDPALLAEWLNAKDVNWPHDKPGEPGATRAS